MMASSRVPLELQNVFINSNQGKEVPPPPTSERGLFLGFTRRWIGSSSGAAAAKCITKARTAHKRTPSTDDVNSGSRRAKPLHGSHQSSYPKQDYLRSSPKKQASDAVERQSSGRLKKNPKKPRICSLSPADYLEGVMRSRGYENSTYKTLETGFFTKPSRLQLASYQSYLLEAVESPTLLRELLQAGLSPNPCNKEGESLLHTVCRRGKAEALKVMIECGCRLQVCDSAGRTPLHDACWSAVPNFEVAELILKHSEGGHGHLFRMDDRLGKSPLHYVCRANWGAWDQFIAKHIDVYWPRNQQNGPNTSPESMVDKLPNSMQVEDPNNALTAFLAEKVASGRLPPSRVALFMDDDDSDTSDASNSTSQGSYTSSYDDSSLSSIGSEAIQKWTTLVATTSSETDACSQMAFSSGHLSSLFKQHARSSSAGETTDLASSWGDISKEIRLRV